jgi:hypothetical protein
VTPEERSRQRAEKGGVEAAPGTGSSGLPPFAICGGEREGTRTHTLVRGERDIGRADGAPLLCLLKVSSNHRYGILPLVLMLCVCLLPLLILLQGYKRAHNRSCVLGWDAAHALSF